MFRTFARGAVALGLLGTSVAATATPTSATTPPPSETVTTEIEIFDADGLPLDEATGLTLPRGNNELDLLRAAADTTAPADGPPGVAAEDAAALVTELAEGASFDDVPTSMSVAAAARAVSFEPTLQDCRGDSRSNGTSGWVATHYTFCSLNFIRFTVYKTTCTNGSCTTQTLGQAEWRQTTRGQGTPSGGRTVNFVSVLDQWILSGSFGAEPITVEIDCNPTVGFACGTTSVPNSYTRSINQWVAANSAFFEFEAHAGTGTPVDDITQADFTERVSTTHQTGALSENTFRCDNATYIAGTIGGCVFPGVVEVLNQPLFNSEVFQSSLHILTAQFAPELTIPAKQNKQIPGSIQSGEPLRRNFYDQSLRDANRRAARRACMADEDSGDYGAPELQCDEYPFASTYQGAASGGDFSVRPISKDDNERGGVYIANFYNGRRVLHEIDQFYVNITPF